MHVHRNRICAWEFMLLSPADMGARLRHHNGAPASDLHESTMRWWTN